MSFTLGLCGGCGFPYASCCCDGSTAPVVSSACPHADPGIQNPASYIATFDYQFAEGRLATGAGLLVNQVDSNGNGSITWSIGPNVPFTQFNLPLNTAITGILAALGAQGSMRRLVPTADGVLFGRASDGSWHLGAIPIATVPDPLTVNLLGATTADITTLNVTGLSTFSGLAAGTITQTIGLDASNHLITGALGHPSLAMYYESTSRTSVATPNSALTQGQAVVIGNELFDPDSISHVQDSTTIVIDTAGTYRIEWTGYITPTAGYGAGGAKLPRLSLAKNSIGTIIAFGNRGVVPSGTAGLGQGDLGGVYFDTLSVNDKLYVIADGTWQNNPSGLLGAGLLLTRMY